MTVIYAICSECGADDCRYDEMEPRCPAGHPWKILTAPAEPDADTEPFEEPLAPLPECCRAFVANTGGDPGDCPGVGSSHATLRPDDAP